MSIWILFFCFHFLCVYFVSPLRLGNVRFWKVHKGLLSKMVMGVIWWIWGGVMICGILSKSDLICLFQEALTSLSAMSSPVRAVSARKYSRIQENNDNRTIKVNFNILHHTKKLRNFQSCAHSVPFSSFVFIHLFFKNHILW